MFDLDERLRRPKRCLHELKYRRPVPDRDGREEYGRRQPANHAAQSPDAEEPGAVEQEERHLDGEPRWLDPKVGWDR